MRHLRKLWLGISWVMLFCSLDPCLFHKCFQQISKPTCASHTHPEVMIPTARCLLTGRNIFFCLLWASTLHQTPVGLVWRRAWTVPLHLPYSWLYQCLSHSCLIIPFPQSSTLLTHSLHWRCFLSLWSSPSEPISAPFPVLLHPSETEGTFKTQHPWMCTAMWWLFLLLFLLNKSPYSIYSMNVLNPWTCVSLGLSSEGRGSYMEVVYQPKECPSSACL